MYFYKNIFLQCGFIFVMLSFVWPSSGRAAAWACKGEATCTLPGSVCADGTVFAGCTPDGSADLYYSLFTTRCDAGQTWSGSCTGTRITRPWNNANTSGYTITSQTSPTQGATNTANLQTGGTAQDSNSGVAGVQPHQAAQYCADLSQDGYTDWYLPSQGELYTLWANSAAIGNFIAGFIWSSTEVADGTGNYAWHQWFPEGNQLASRLKSSSINFRCVRR